MSDAELLRRAAKLMRDRAAAVSGPGPWHVEDGEHVCLCDDRGRIEVWDADTAEHIASWSPTVAVAVADWLDGFAGEIEVLNGHVPDCRPCAPALAVARAYLGERAEQVTG